MERNKAGWPDLGMPTLLELKSTEECAALCRELGLDFLELNMNLPQYQAGRLDVSQLRRIAGEYGIYYTIHLDENLSVADFNPRVAEAYRETVFDTIELAGEMDIPVLNMHLADGVYFTLPDRRTYLFEEYGEEYRRSLRAFRDECERRIGGTPALICVENCGGYAGFQREALDLLLESPVFALTLDAGHSHAAGLADEPFLLGRRERLRHVHLHDGAGRQNHLALGTGEMDLPRYAELAAECRCRIVLETKTAAGLRQSAAWMKRYRAEREIR